MLILLILLTLGNSNFLEDRARWMLNISQAPGFVSVINGIQYPSLSYTDMNTKLIYIDMERFQCCPNTFTNVINHEIGHTKGMMHNDASGSVMNYSVRVDEDGELVEDTYLYPFNAYALYANAPTHQ